MTMPPHSLLHADDVLPDLIAWRRTGMKAALVTLVAIDGATPRPLGAQMAVGEDGRYVGYLSGGCLEQSVALEAQAAIRDGQNRLQRFGKGSPYFDIKLPCGSGLDIYFDQGIGQDVLDRADALLAQRRAFVVSTNLDSGASSIDDPIAGKTPCSERRGTTFNRAHVPRPRVLLVGGGPMLVAIAGLVTSAGFETDIVSPDADARDAVKVLGFATEGLTNASDLDVSNLDRWSAAIVAFHEHDWEAPILARILPRPCFYIGVLGGRKAHADRVEKLGELGFGPDAISRLRCPVGLIPGAKSRISLAAGILAELVSEAKAAGIVS